MNVGIFNLKIHEIHDLTNHELINTLELEFSKITDTAIIKNYHPDYSQVPGNIFKILSQGRYRLGKYFIITDDDDKYMCSAGWNPYELETDTALLLTRMYVNPQYRGQYVIGKTVLPQMISEACNYQRLWITANDHNRTIYKYFERSSQNKRTVLFNDWPDIYKRFKPIGKKTVYYTEQWISEYDKTTCN